VVFRSLISGRCGLAADIIARLPTRILSRRAEFLPPADAPPMTIEALALSGFVRRETPASAAISSIVREVELPVGEQSQGDLRQLATDGPALALADVDRHRRSVYHSARCARFGPSCTI